MKRPFAAYTGDEPYVFVCYAHEDADLVYPEIQRLHEGGVRIWYDEGISPGARWSDELAQHLSCAALVLFFCTPQSVNRKHCLNEIDLAIDQGRPLLVIQNGSFDLPIGLKLQLGSHQAILKHELKKDQFAEKLATAIRGHVTAAPSTAALVVDSKTSWWRSRLAGVVAVALPAVVIISATAWQLYEREYFWTSPLADARTQRLTDFVGDEFDAAISADAKFTAFIADRHGRFESWLGQSGSGDYVDVTNGRFDDIGLLDATVRRVGFAGDGSELWMQTGMRYPTSIWKASTLGGEWHPFIPGGGEPAWSPDGQRIAYHTADPGDPIFIADATGANPMQLFVDPGRHCHHLLWSPDAKFIYFVGGYPTTAELDIYRIPVRMDGGAVEPEQITHQNTRMAYLAWLDGRTLVYSATGENGSDVWLYAIDVEHRVPHRVSGGIAEQYLSVATSTTGSPRRLVATLAVPTVTLWSVPLLDHQQTEADAKQVVLENARALSPRFTSDGMLFVSSTRGTDGLWRLNGKKSRELWRSSEGGVVGPPAVSPDGRLIALSVRTQGKTRLRLINADGTQTRTIAGSLDVRGSATWSPDSRWLAVAASEGEGTRLFKISVEGGTPILLVPTRSFDPLWFPDGKRILYTQPLRAAALDMRAVTPNGVAMPLPEILVPYVSGSAYRLIPNADALVVLGGGTGDWANFYRVELSTGERRQLTNLRRDYTIQNFDITPDGSAIVFDRKRFNADIVAIDLPAS